MAAAVIRARARGRFFNLVDLVNQLEQEKAAGRSGRLAEKLLRHDLIVIDSCGVGGYVELLCFDPGFAKLSVDSASDDST